MFRKFFKKFQLFQGRKTIALGDKNHVPVALTATAIEDYQAKTNLEISFSQGEVLTIIDKLPKYFNPRR
jgi:hypothetical protein